MILLESHEIERAAELLKMGDLVAFPTETVYGLGAPIFNPHAVAKIFEAKGRPADNPLIAHLSGLEQVNQIAREIPSEFYDFAEKYFPGPLTIILKKHPSVPSIVSGGLDTIALRMPDHPIAKSLIEAVGQPLVAPSANLSGKPSSTEVSHVIHDFEGKIAAVIDGGKTFFGIESTVISLVGEPMILRKGAISFDFPEAKDKSSSPGTRYRHYAPKAKVRLFQSKEAIKAHDRAILIKPRQSDLYALLRKADDEGFEEIHVLCDFSDEALMDRLYKASCNDSPE